MNSKAGDTMEEELLLDHMQAYEVLKNMHVPFDYKETFDIIHKYLDDDNQETTVPPKVIARELMEADKGLFMTDEVFEFVEKVLKDTYFFIKESHAAVELGNLYYFERYNHINYENALKYYLKGKNFYDGSKMAGECFLLGRGTEENYMNAFYMLLPNALTAEDAKSLYLLGDMYFYGYYVEEDVGVAFDIYEHAYEVTCNKETSHATKAEIMYRLGIKYFLGFEDMSDLHASLEAFNQSEQQFYYAIQECNPSLKDRVDTVHQKQEEVKEEIRKILFSEQKLKS